MKETSPESFELPPEIIREIFIRLPDKSIAEPKRVAGDEVNLHCTSWRLAAETNNLAPWSTIPAECTDYVKDYVLGKGYVADLERVSEEASVFASTVDFSAARRQGCVDFRHRRDSPVQSSLLHRPWLWVHVSSISKFSFLILLLTTEQCCRVEVFDHSEFNKWVERGVAPAIAPSLKLYQRVIDLGYKVFLLTGRKESHMVVTVENLINAGFQNWDKLILRYT
ncbi:hypothetical protein DY000_02061935 [Brassica cretica]|uniref:F-box domain-containing protein n=1 Tax=Brassica cretica TaxID=69181 RepID=A0ABQ7AR87_BRACR|nr:hypothetical protein DY000_02061935 [Brassica cretica]